ncbi:oleate hydratase, partial [Bradyrhizobium liaoningense]|uniref:oleate hydratase n=1 Tax=Bradyrhizobium liaoningense TaxID=43992 RepID=UPI001FCC8FD4
MYYTSGNYEAFARPRKPAGVDSKTAWFVGSGLAALSGAAFLIRDGQMRGDGIVNLIDRRAEGGASQRFESSRWRLLWRSRAKSQ